YNLYPTADDRWMTVGNVETKFWENFCRTVGHEDWISERLNRTTEFRETVSELFRTRNLSEWVEVFRNVDTCVEPVLTLNEAAAKGLFRYPEKPAPKLGENTKAVFKEFGLGDV